MRRKELVSRSRTGINMAVGQKETGTLQVHVGIDVDEGIATDFLTTVSVLLDGKLSQLWKIVRTFILSKERHATT